MISLFKMTIAKVKRWWYNNNIEHDTLAYELAIQDLENTNTELYKIICERNERILELERMKVYEFAERNGYNLLRGFIYGSNEHKEGVEIVVYTADSSKVESCMPDCTCNRTDTK